MRKIFLLLLISTLSFQSFASHLMGGEITWKCITSGPDAGKYVFTLKIYRDCDGINVSQLPQTISVWNHPTVTSISAPLWVDPTGFPNPRDVSPDCDPINSGNQQLNCANNPVGAVERYVFESAPINLPGSPPAAGWHFTWDNCCRNTAVTNLVNPSSMGFTLRASMYQYNDPITGIVTPADPCFDSSPSFKEDPKTILCIGYPFSYSHNAFDVELDSLVYSWGEPLDDFFGTYNPPVAPPVLTFNPPYNVNTPLPGAPTLDAQTGEVSYNANTAGYFVTCVKVSSYKCGQLVAEIFREVQVVLIACPTMPGTGLQNNPPDVSAPFIDPVTMLPSYETTVFAGDLVTFNISGTDPDLYNGVLPQNLTLDVSGGQFGSPNASSTTNCENPPCATFNNGFGIVPPFTAPGIVSGVFSWQTACSHIAANAGCGSTSNVYTFLIKVNDDFCPANGIKFSTIKVTVLPAPVDNPPDPRCISVLENGNVEITWEHLLSAPPSTVYSIFHSTNPNGPFTFVDSVLFPNNTYLDLNVNANNQRHYYYLTSHSDCADESNPSDTLSSINLNVTAINASTQGDLNWNHLHIPSLTTSSPNYQIFAKDGNGIYQNVGQTPDINYIFDAITCDSYQAMYVTLEDQSGCISKSSIDGDTLQDKIPPNVPIITDVSVNTNGKSVINWTCNSIDVDLYELYQLTEEGWLLIGSINPPDLSFTFDNSNAVNFSETFSVRALDSCGNASQKSLEHNSINIETKVDVCNFTVDVSWNNYINITNGLSHYEVNVTETNIFGGITNTVSRVVSPLNYTITNINEGSSYFVYVTAYNADSMIFATSDQLNEPIDLPMQPQYNYIQYASVNHDNDFVEISCLTDNQGIVDHYDVMRSLGTSNDFYKIGEIPFNASVSLDYVDESAKTNENFYQYKIFPVDTCGVRLAIPPVYSLEFFDDTSFGQTIFLQAEINLDYSNSLVDEYTNTLTFNEYDKWLGSVSEYRLYRSINRQPFSLVPLHVWDRINNPDEELKFIDVVTEYGDGNGRFCYYIQAIEGTNNPYGSSTNGSYSNIACVSQTPIIFTPSVFTPNGDDHNELFKPITYFVSEQGYSFTIYNRQGMEIFNTDIPSKGWDGTHNGNQAPDGNYIYHIQFMNGIGKLTEKTNVITLVR